MFAVIYIPDFFLQAALRHEPELVKRPVALIDESATKAVIIQMTEAARRSGVRTGMTSTQAMARCREIVIKPRSALHESAASDALLQMSFLFSPYVEASGPGICTLDLKGQQPFMESKADVIGVLAKLHLRAQVGLAGTPGVALHAARCADRVLRVDDAPAFLSKLPVEQLAPSPSLLTILQKWGIRTVGEFLRLGKDALAERLGVEALELCARATVGESRPLKLAQLPEVFEETFEFENEIESLEPLLFILRRFLEQLGLRLGAACFAAEEILLRLTLSNDTCYERAFKIPAPTIDVDVLFRILFTHLENVRTEHPMKGLYVRAKPCRPSSEQFGLFDCALRDPNRFYETIARLTALLGADRVGIPAPLSRKEIEAVQLSQRIDAH